MSSAGDAEFQVVDVFSDRPYSGNPTCVCFSEGASDAWMSKFAMESNQPTTSFVDLSAGSYRTFGPNGVELSILSGHSSLGVAAAVFSSSPGLAAAKLSTRYGTVHMAYDGEMYEVGLPRITGAEIENVPLAPLQSALGLADAEDVLRHGSVLGDRFLFLEVTPESFSAMTPDIGAIRVLTAGKVGLFVTAEGMAVGHPACPQPERVAFSARNFVPSLGIDEDIATGSIQAFLNPYWADRLGWQGAQNVPLLCWQNSPRGGLIRSRQQADAILVAGQCAMSLRGTAPRC